jgi:hypothetical protein
MPTLHVTLNYLGVPVNADYVARLRDGADHSGDFEYRMIAHVLEVPPQHVPPEVLERYVEVSSQQTYTPIFPHTDRLFERFLVPLKSAKRCYCFGEYLATVELCAHVGEMLALLIWQMTPVKLNGTSIDATIEKALWGREFEKFGQEQRIDVLKAVGAIPDADTQLLDFLRVTRRKYFHFWDTPTTNLKSDSLACFLKLSTLIHNSLQIEYDNGAVKMNPLLLAYLQAHPQPTDPAPDSDAAPAAAAPIG